MKNRTRLVVYFLLFLIVFLAIAKLAGHLILDEPLMPSLIDFRFPLFWAALGTWILNAARKNKQDRNSRD